MLKGYSSIKELVNVLRETLKLEIIDGWQENKYWVSVTGGDIVSIKNPETGEFKTYQRGIFKIKTMLPI